MNKTFFFCFLFIPDQLLIIKLLLHYLLEAQIALENKYFARINFSLEVKHFTSTAMDDGTILKNEM